MESDNARKLLNQMNGAGCTPLMVLLSTNGASDHLVELALERGAVDSITRANRKKHTAEDYARMGGREQLALKISELAAVETKRTSDRRYHPTAAAAPTRGRQE